LSEPESAQARINGEGEFEWKERKVVADSDGLIREELVRTTVLLKWLSGKFLSFTTLSRPFPQLRKRI
jgi:hypothetical protein